MNNISKKLDVMIVGMQKCGTTSLLRYLNDHSQIATHPQMEMTYFYLDKEYENGWKQASKHYFNKALNNKIWVAKHATTVRSINALRRLKDHNPNVKCILILREPTARAWSSFLMEVKNGLDLEIFDDQIMELYNNKMIDSSNWYQNVFFGLGIYHLFLEKLYRIINKENIKVILLEDIKQQRDKVLIDLFEWLDLSIEKDAYKVVSRKVYNSMHSSRNKKVTKMINTFLSEQNPLKLFLKKLLPSKILIGFGQAFRKLNVIKVSKPIISESSKKKLNDFYAPHNKILITKYGLNLDNWK